MVFVLRLERRVDREGADLDGMGVLGDADASAKAVLDGISARSFLPLGRLRPRGERSVPAVRGQAGLGDENEANSGLIGFVRLVDGFFGHRHNIQIKKERPTTQSGKMGEN